eukprot:8349527-Pyramimonas_sp.AAC.1
MLWTLRAVMWILRAMMWTLRAVRWILRAMLWTLRAVMWILRAVRHAGERGGDSEAEGEESPGALHDQEPRGHARARRALRLSSCLHSQITTLEFLLKVQPSRQSPPLANCCLVVNCNLTNLAPKLLCSAAARAICH